MFVIAFDQFFICHELNKILDIAKAKERYYR